MLSPSMSSRPLDGSEYTDGEVYDINTPGRALLRNALIEESWVNMSESSRQAWLDLMFSDMVRFVGTVLSAVRSQVEITIVFNEPHPLYGGMVSFCVTLFRFWRFRSLLT